MNQKFLLTTFIITSSIAALTAQTTQEISTGASYSKQSYVNLQNGTQNQVDNTTWDIAFTVYGVQDGGVFINESAASGANAIEAYDLQTDDFDAIPDVSALAGRVYNPEKTWAYGALNNGVSSDDPFNYGWGVYIPATNSVSGWKVFVLKLRNGAYRKFQVVSLVGTTYTFRYANLDGTGLTNVTLNKSDYPGRTLAYFSVSSGTEVTVEPATGFDLLFCRYTTTLLEPGTGVEVPYVVAGVLSGRNVEVAEADGVNIQTVAYSDWKDSLRSDLDVIGHDWKAFNNGWSVDEDRVYFVRTANDRVWKLHFFDFEGSSTGTAVLDKTDLGIISAVKDPNSNFTAFSVFPNPVHDKANVVFSLKSGVAKEGVLQLVNLQGQTVLSQAVTLQQGLNGLELPVQQLASGIYQAVLMAGNDIVSQKIVIE